MSKELTKKDVARMQKIHSQFVTETKADPALAQDLLDATDWNYAAAIEAYKGLSVTFTEQSDTKQFDDVDDAAITGLLNEGGGGGYSGKELSPVDESTSLEDLIAKTPKRRRGKAKGLGHVADLVEDMFIKVAVSESKLKAGSDKKEKVFDEQFFRHSFLYPDLSSLSEELTTFIQSDIIEKSHKHTLSKAGRLNWWASTGKLPVLEPLATTGDGNCLLHAASLYMWGLPDSYLILRTHLHRILTTGIEKEGIQRRWRYLTNLRNQEAGGLVFSEEEWEFEWSEIVRIATSQPRRRPTTDSLKRYSTLRTHYESLEEVHVFAMAHVLRRPIIVVADEFVRDMNGEPFAPIYFGGIYLPLECAPSSCYNSPLILAFDSSHFSPLVGKRDPVILQKQQQNSRLRHLPSRQDTVMPLVTPDGSLLSMPFIYDPKKKNVAEKWANEKCQLGDFPDELRTILESYLDIRWIQLKIGSQLETQEQPSAGDDDTGFQGKVPKFRFPAAVVSVLGEPEYQSVLVVKYFENAQERFKIEKERKEKLAAEKAKQEEELRRIQLNRPVPCQGKGCKMFGTAASDGLCSKCYNKMQKANKKAASSSGGKKDSTADSPSSEIASYPGKWEIIMPDVIADTGPSEHQLGSSDGDRKDDDNGDVKLISQHPVQDSTDGGSSPGVNLRNSPPKSPLKIPSASKPAVPKSSSKQKSSPRSPPKSPPKTPPEPPPRSSKTPPTSPAKSSAVPPLKPVSTKSPLHAHQAPPPRQTGYSRDNIRPLQSTSSSSNCVGGCGFFGSPQYQGMCSQCYKKAQTAAGSGTSPSITQV